jgi:hypothetical protein
MRWEPRGSTWTQRHREGLCIGERRVLAEELKMLVGCGEPLQEQPAEQA